ncbi:LemA family protein [bacterium]|nr:LemA family protein [bacterium]
MILVYILIAVILLVIYLLKINFDLLNYKDKSLRALAALDAAIIKKNIVILDILGYARENMPKEDRLICELFNIRHDISKIRTKIVNAQERFEKQKEFDSKVEILLGAATKYSDLKKNIGFQQCLENFYNLESEFNTRVEDYNLIVNKFYSLVHTFPGSIIAKLTKTMEPPATYEK